MSKINRVVRRRDIARNDLSNRVDTCIGSSGQCHLDRSPENLLKRAPEVTDDGSNTGAFSRPSKR